MGGTRDQWLFSCPCWELCSDSDERQEGDLPTPQQRRVEARLVQWEVDWLVQSHLVLEQQTFLLLGTLPVLTAISSYSTIPKAFPFPAASRLLLLH